MNCSHPVIYTDKDGKYCHCCGARIGDPAVSAVRVDENPSEETKPQETAKKPAKRTGRK